LSRSSQKIRKQELSVTTKRNNMQIMDRQPMRSFRTLIVVMALVAGIVILVSSAAGSPGIQTTLGDKVTISGYSYGSPWVYLFLTGPNLPVNGVALNDITKRADQGGFTIVDVDGNNHWVYNWNTAAPGGKLDAGTYMIFVVNGPNDRSRLSEADYSTISVTLGEPSISVETSALTGGMDLRSVPEGASLMVNGEYRGKTPMTVSDLAAGTYNVTFSRFGFVEVSMPVLVQPGKLSEVNATLLPRVGTLMVVTSPAGARIRIDGADAGVSPVTFPNLTADNHTLTIEKEGYSLILQPVRIIAGQTVPVEIALVPLPPQPTARAATVVPTPVTGIGIVLLLLSFNHLRYPRRR
jgi:hypothetical protein